MYHFHNLEVYYRPVRVKHLRPQAVIRHILMLDPLPAPFFRIICQVPDTTRGLVAEEEMPKWRVVLGYYGPECRQPPHGVVSSAGAGLRITVLCLRDCLQGARGTV